MPDEHTSRSGAPPDDARAEPLARVVYKLCSATDWTAALAAGTYLGSADDARDGYIHFSTARQLPGTAAKYFRNHPDLVLVAVEAQALGQALWFEPSRGGELFPHLYASLDPACVLSVDVLALDADGVPILPEALRTEGRL